GAAGNDGTDGKDGITPQFKIEDADWYISLNNGQSWDYMGRATGADGANGTGGDSMFSSIDTSNPESVTFTLSNGTSFTLARVAELAITFDQDGLLAMYPGTTRTIAYTVTGNTDGLKVEVLTSGNVRAKLSEGSAATGSIVITTGATVTEYDKVILLASNGSTTVMSSISFQESDCLVVTGGTSYAVNATGGTISINIETNTDYTLSIPTAAQSWISVDGSRAMRRETITLNIAANDGASRTATLALIDKDGNPLANIRISQAGNAGSSTIPANMEEAFPDMFFRAYVLEHFDTDGDNIISQEEADKVEQITIYGEDAYKRITSIQGIQYFPNLNSLNVRVTQLKELDVSLNKKLEYLNCSSNQELSSVNTSNLPILRNLDCGFCVINSLNVTRCCSLTYLICGYNMLENIDVSDCLALERFSCV
ncbi:MAG: hypothetical protein K2L99_01225, partial [Muribaculaceae bacterium]|nr:hypothetical protein [Muribaculaceae bacterium]